MRVNLRFKFGDYTFFTMVSKTQTLQGITSKTEDGTHIILFDLEAYTGENIRYQDVKKELLRIQKKYDLPDIFVVSDKPDKSWHGYCFKRVDLRQYLMILCDCKYTDWNFIHWTVQRGEATLRITSKVDRPVQDVIDILHSDETYNIPTSWEVVTYDTGIDKRGLVFSNSKS